MPDETQTQTPSESQAQPLPSRPAATDRTAAAPGTRLGTVWITRLVMAAIVLAALNLRPAITSLGALLEETRDGLQMSGSVAGVLTSVPPLCFAVFGIAAPVSPAVSDPAPSSAPAWSPSPPGC